MSFTIDLQINHSEKRALSKYVTSVLSLTGTLKSDTSVIDPIILIQCDLADVANINYMTIPIFGRSYFVKDIVIKENGHYDVYCEVDVLESFKSVILNNPCIVEAAESSGYDDYLPHESFVSTVKHKTDIIKFTGGLNDTGEFILITAGG